MHSKVMQQVIQFIVFIAIVRITLPDVGIRDAVFTIVLLTGPYPVLVAFIAG